MSNSFNSEIMEDELNTVLLSLTPDDPRYTSLEGWSDLTLEAQAAVQMRYADAGNWNELIQHTCASEHYATLVCNYCYNFVASFDLSLGRRIGDTFFRLHKKNCPQNNTNKLKTLTDLNQSLTEKIQALTLENEILKLQIQNFEDESEIMRNKIVVELCNYLELNSET